MGQFPHLVSLQLSHIWFGAAVKPAEGFCLVLTCSLAKRGWLGSG